MIHTNDSPFSHNGDCVRPLRSRRSRSHRAFRPHRGGRAHRSRSYHGGFDSLGVGRLGLSLGCMRARRRPPRVGLALERRIVYPAVRTLPHGCRTRFNLVRSDRVRVTRIARSGYGYGYGCACWNGSRVHVRYVLSVVIMGAWMGRARRGRGILVPNDGHDNLPLLLKIRTLVNCVHGCCARVQTSATTHPYQIWLGYHHGANQSSVRRIIDWTIQIMFFRADDPI